MAKKKSVYAISIGRRWGYRTNYDDVLQEIHQYQGAEFKGFFSAEEAKRWMNEPRRTKRREQHLARIKESSAEARRRLEDKVKALNDKIALEAVAELTINEMELDNITRGGTSTPSPSSRCSRCSTCSCSSSPDNSPPSSPTSTKPVKTISSPVSD
ncbi:hypothetical protein F52700_890 [Fusarium sp. NRRL 52700]|nr:hypothetical protein F52700_890 [Fusarium sp. NRRL 52700]